ncbi:hypothetical protein D3C73_1203080 [compost metagenome]
MKTEAEEGGFSCASGSLSGTAMWTRACTTPSMEEMVWPSSCCSAYIMRMRCSIGEETKPSFWKTSPMLAKFWRG